MEILILIILLILSGCFSGVETALVSVSMSKVSLLIRKKEKHAETLLKVKNNPHRMLTTILIGNNIVNVSAATLTTIIVSNYGNRTIGIATGVLTLLILIFGEITPKSIATRYSTQISLKTAPIIYLLQKIFTPVIWFLDLFTIKVIDKVLGPAPKPKITEDELKNYIKLTEQSGSIDKEETEMLQNIIEFEDMSVKEIMTPRPQIKKVTENTSIKKVIQLIIKSGHTRIPVTNTKRHFVGVVLAKDLMSHMSKGKLNITAETVKRKAHFVPETKKLNELFKEFKHGKTHMALVVDEYGLVSGLVTLEDLLEEIVGDLFDETDKPLRQVKEISEGKYNVKGITYLDDVNSYVGIHLDTNADVESLGGYIIEKMGKIPKEGDTLKEKGIEFVVKSVDENRIEEVQIIIKRRQHKS